VIYYLGLIFYYAVRYGHSLGDLDVTSNNYGRGFIKFVFALHCQFSFLDIFSEMEDKSLSSISIVCAIVSVAIALIYSASGFLGYVAIGKEIGNRHILDIFIDKNTEFMRLIAKDPFNKHGIPTNIALGIFLFVWFGFLNFATAPVITIIQSYLLIKGKPVQRTGISVAVALYFLAAGIPKELNISTILDVCAAVFTNPLSFAFPAMFMILTTPRFSGKSILSYLLIGFSIVIMCVILRDAFL
jgi:amino acid permease